MRQLCSSASFIVHRWSMWRSVLDQMPVKKFCSCASASRLAWAVSSSEGWQTTSMESTRSTCRCVSGLKLTGDVVLTSVLSSLHHTGWTSIYYNCLLPPIYADNQNLSPTEINWHFFCPLQCTYSICSVNHLSYVPLWEKTETKRETFLFYIFWFHDGVS